MITNKDWSQAQKEFLKRAELAQASNQHPALGNLSTLISSGHDEVSRALEQIDKSPLLRGEQIDCDELEKLTNTFATSKKNYLAHLNRVATEAKKSGDAQDNKHKLEGGLDFIEKVLKDYEADFDTQLKQCRKAADELKNRQEAVHKSLIGKEDKINKIIAKINASFHDMNKHAGKDAGAQLVENWNRKVQPVVDELYEATHNCCLELQAANRLFASTDNKGAVHRPDWIAELDKKHSACDEILNKFKHTGSVKDEASVLKLKALVNDGIKLLNNKMLN